jgi:AcrR family transcriptional regulator
MGKGSSRSASARLGPAHRPSRRAEIIAAAIVEFGSAESLEAVSVSQIIARTGMGMSAFYYHFASIDEVLEVVVDELFAGVAARFAVRPGEESLAVWAAGAVGRQVRWLGEHPAETRLLVVFSNGSLGGPTVLAAVHDGMTRTVVPISESLLEMSPALPVLEAEVVSRALVSLVIELADAALDPGLDPTTGLDSLATAAEVLAVRLVTDAGG